MAEPYDLETQAVIQQAKRRYTATDSHHAALLGNYRQWHRLYAPPRGDQWPEDAEQRPGKIHITSNIVKPFVDIDGRLQAKLPRISLIPIDLSDKERARAEMAEKLVQTWLDASDWEWWMQRLTRGKGIYGKGVLFPFWNKEERRPDVLHLEQPHNLRVGWGSNDFTTKDWALYEYTLSRTQVEERWPDVIVTDRDPGDATLPLTVTLGGNTHEDPLAQRMTNVSDPMRQPTDYERKHIVVWDYWYRKGGEIYNCILLQRECPVKAPTLHKEYAAIPYIVVENDHEPGSPEGLSTVAQLADIQIEMNRALSQFVQLIVDNLDPAWQVDDDSVPDGVVPKAGEIIAAGDEHQIRPIEKTVNTFPIDQLLSALWNQAHRTTGEGEILFGAPASAQDSGRALAVQIESVINRMEPKRAELYSGLRELIQFWVVMVERIDPKFDEFRPSEIVKNQRRWKVVAPEVTPKDQADHTNTVINKLNAMLIDLRTAMDELGVDAPEDMLEMISKDRSTLPLYPGNVQAMAQVGLLLLQLQQMGMSMEQIAQGVSNGGMPGQEGVNNAKAQQQQALPQRGEDDNQGQPATGQGGVPPLQATSLVRSSATQESQALNQLAFNAPVGPVSG